jgi:hypothetical protein
MVEIAKALSFDSKLIIMDDPEGTFEMGFGPAPAPAAETPDRRPAPRVDWSICGDHEPCQPHAAAQAQDSIR